jgi:O-antigen ligase
MTAPAAALAPGAGLGRARAVLWVGVAVAAGGAAALGAAPIVLLLLPLLLASVLALLGSDLAFLWILVASAGLGIGWAEGAAFQIAANTINVGGVRWGLIFLVTAFVLVRRRALRLPVTLAPYAVFVALATVGILWAGDRFEGIKNGIQYATPLLLGLLAYDLAKREPNVEALRTAFWLGLVVSATAAVVPGLIGASLDPDGRLINRAFATYTLPLAALALASMRHRDRRWLLAFGAVLGLALLAQSRTSIAALLLLALLSGLHGAARGFRVATLVLVAGVAFAGLSYPPLRARLVAEGAQGLDEGLAVTGSGEAARIQVGGVELSGRGLLWLQTWRHALQKPLLGHGTGSATAYLETTFPGGAVHPHNDYLRAFHDLGVVGLASVLAFAVLVPFGLLRRHRRARDALGRELALAAFLAWVAYLAIAVFDNAFIYVTTLTQNVFVLTGLALGWDVADPEPASSPEVAPVVVDTGPPAAASPVPAGGGS